MRSMTGRAKNTTTHDRKAKMAEQLKRFQIVYISFHLPLSVCCCISCILAHFVPLQNPCADQSSRCTLQFALVRIAGKHAVRCKSQYVRCVCDNLLRVMYAAIVPDGARVRCIVRMGGNSKRMPGESTLSMG